MRYDHGMLPADRAKLEHASHRHEHVKYFGIKSERMMPFKALPEFPHVCPVEACAICAWVARHRGLHESD